MLRGGQPRSRFTCALLSSSSLAAFCTQVVHRRGSGGPFILFIQPSCFPSDEAHCSVRGIQGPVHFHSGWGGQAPPPPPNPANVEPPLVVIGASVCDVGKARAMFLYWCWWPGPGWRCVAATCDSARVCAVHVLDGVPAQVACTPPPALTLWPLVLGGLSRPDGDSPHGDQHDRVRLRGDMRSR